MTLDNVKLPSFVTVGGSLFFIKTDFRFWLKFARLINSKETLLKDLDFLYEDKKPVNRIDGFNALMDFYNPIRELPRSTGDGGGEKVLDYDLDSELIYSAFYEQYGIDLFDEDLRLHWHKFTALLSGLHGTKLNDVMSYRCYSTNNNVKYEDHMKKLKRAWALPQNVELSEETKAFNALFEKKN